MSASRLKESPWAVARWLVIAPHADDETLGAGALIAETAKTARLAGVVYLTDGSGSHPEGTARLALVRRAEARLALHRLTGSDVRTFWLGWRDARPHGRSEPAFRRSRDRLAALLRILRVDAIAVTAAAEPHRDHAAAHALAGSAIAAAHRKVALFEYCVWSRSDRSRRAVRTESMAIGRRRHALRSHRSQLTISMGPGFRLSRQEQRMPGFDILYLDRAQ